MGRGCTLTVTACSTESMDRFFSIDCDSSFRRGVERLIADGISRPQWCFIASDGETAVGRVGYLQPCIGELRIFGLTLPQHDRDAGTKLLEESLGIMKHSGTARVTCQLHTDELPPYSELLCSQVGMRVVQEKVRFMRDCSVSGAIHQRLRFVSVREAGYELFIRTVRDVTRDTLDRTDAASVTELGEEQAATQYSEELSSIDNAREHWYLAYQGNEVTGLVVPQVLEPGVGAINYIGVVPEQRGRGYVGDLLYHGIGVLQARGCSQVIADIDSQNRPLEDALVKGGFLAEKRILLFELCW